MKRTLLLLLVLLPTVAMAGVSRFDGAVGSTSLRYREDAIDTTGMVGYWPMNETSGDTAFDYSSFDNDGILGGHPDSTAKQPTQVANGYSQGCLSFDGVDDFVDCGSETLTTGAATISMWCNSRASQGTPLAGFLISSGLLIYHYSSLGGNESLFMGFRGEHEMYIPANSVTNGIWQYLAFIYTGEDDDLATSYRIYIDGISQVVTRRSTSIGSSTTRNYIGREEGVSRFSGLIDEVRIWNYARTPAQIKSDFQKGVRFE